MFIDGENAVWMNYMRNLFLDSSDAHDAIDKFKYQGGLDTSSDLTFTQAPCKAEQTIVRDRAATAAAVDCRVQIPLDLITSFLFHKFPTTLADKISVEIRFKNMPTGHLETDFISSVAGPPIYPALRVTNSFITQRCQLYTDPALLWPLSQPYMKSLVKTEVQQFLLPGGQSLSQASFAAGFTAANPMIVRFRLSDAFALHKRILGFSFAISAADPGAPVGTLVGQQWGPNIMGARVFKGGKIVEDLSSIPKYGRQADHFLKCLGCSWTPQCAITEDINLPVHPVVLFQNNWNIWSWAGSYLSFLDRNCTRFCIIFCLLYLFYKHAH